MDALRVIFVSCAQRAHGKYPDTLDFLLLLQHCFHVRKFVEAIAFKFIFQPQECSDYLQNGGRSVNFSPELYLEEQLHGWFGSQYKVNYMTNVSF